MGKADLIERLQTSEAIVEDDILDQDDSMTEEAIKQAEEELKSQSPTKVKRTQIGFNKTGSKPAESEKGKENEPTAEKIETQSSPTKDDVAEKIKSRAERFGGFQSDDAKKAARAAKFGDMLGKQQGGGKITSAGTEVDVDLLKKRADRFGTATSRKLKIARKQKITYSDLRDPNFKRIKYARYADDFVIGISGDKKFAKQIMDKVKVFLKTQLHLNVSEDKSSLLSIVHRQAFFLGFLLKKIPKRLNPAISKNLKGKEKRARKKKRLKHELAMAEQRE